MVLDKLPALLSTPAHSTNRVLRKVPLNIVMLVPLLVQVVAAVGAVGWLSYKNGQRAVNEVATQLRNEAGSRIYQHLDGYLSAPIQINRTNADAAELGLLDLNNFQTTGKYFWRQMQTFNVGYISFGKANGDFVGVERLDSGELLINEISAQTRGKVHAFATNSAGDRTKQTASRTWNPRIEPWYADTVKVGKPVWSPIYQWLDKPEVMSVSANYPLYDRDRHLLGVLSVDQILTQISHFLSGIKVSPSGRTYILERSGALVATSSPSEKPFRLVGDDAERLNATDSKDPLIHDSASYLAQHFGDLARIRTPQQLDFLSNGNHEFLLVMPWQDQSGLDWLIVVVVPEDDFMAQIHENTRNTLISCAIALAMAILLGIPTSRWVVWQILQLSQASEALADGHLNQTVHTRGIAELETLAKSFNRMAQQLRESFAVLEQTNELLEERVEERTASLAAAEAELRALFAAMRDLVIVYDRTGRFLKIVSNSSTTLIRPISEQVGKRVHDILPASQADVILHGIQQALTTRQMVTVEYSLPNTKPNTDDLLWFSANVSPLSDSTVLWVARDISDRKRSEAERQRNEKALQISQEKFSKAFTASPDFITISSLATGRFIEVNDSFLAGSGYTREEVLGKNMTELGAWVNQRDREQLQKQIAQHDYVQGLEIELRKKNGDVIVALLSAQIIELEGEACMLAVTKDITKLKQAEAALQEKEQYLRLILNNIPQQVFWKDTNLVFLGCNQNWAEAAELESPEAIIGKTDYDLLSDRATAAYFRSQDQQIIDTDQPQIHLIAPKVKPIDDSITWLDISKIPIHDPAGKVIGILGVVEDITLRKQAEEALTAEQQKSENLLLNVLPAAIADRLKQSMGVLHDPHSTTLIAENFAEVTVLFADIVNFTTLSSNVSAADLVGLLNSIFMCFDDLCEKHGLEKIKTIGDAYMVAGGLPNPRPDHAAAIANMALDMRQNITQFRNYQGNPIDVRIGINTGSVIAGVIGKKKFTYDLWGDTVNTASRMESHGVANKIQVTETTYQHLNDHYLLERRGAIDIKGKGEMNTYWLLGKRDA